MSPFSARESAKCRLRWLLAASMVVVTAARPVVAQQSELQLRDDVLSAIDQGKRFLLTQQEDDGSWATVGAGRYEIGVTSLAVLALVNCGMTPEDREIAKALKWLRKLPPGKPTQTYEVSLMISALVAAKAKGKKDLTLIHRLAARLEKSQTTNGSWGYSAMSPGRGDPSNAQFGILGLRDAASTGYIVDRKVWARADKLWRDSQGFSGGWSYDSNNTGDARGSMTCAGIATLAITRRMLRDDRDVKADGSLECCLRPPEDKELEKGLNWLANHFSVQSNPGSANWTLYYLYALERAGRLTGRRFVGRHDWYRAGARQLAGSQRARGDWDAGGGEQGTVGCSLALLFLSKGLARVVVNKLEFGAPDPNNNRRTTSRDWNNHPDDVRNLVEMIGGLPDWPRLLTTQTVNMYQLQPDTAVAELSQAPICYISGAQSPTFTAQQVAALRAYVDSGGFIVAVATCESQDFDPGMRDLIKRMFPEGAELKRLKQDHPIFRAEFELPAESVELYGVDFGCRTPIVYSPVDVACYWNKWMRNEPFERKTWPKEKRGSLRTRMTRDMRIGVNIVAYATGREPPIKLHDMAAKKIAGESRIERGLLEIAKLKHGGGWDTAPRALRNLLLSLNQTVGQGASTKPKALAVMSEDIFNHPLLYMHGRNSFRFSRQEREQIRSYLSRGHVLFADSCCGARQFDQSFRAEIKELFPDAELKRIPVNHELFSDRVGYDITMVERRVPAVGRDAKFEAKTEKAEPYLEGIEIDGRLAVIYSKYDISCALERQATAACSGYVEKDATKIGINVVLYALLQDVN